MIYFYLFSKDVPFTLILLWNAFTINIIFHWSWKDACKLWDLRLSQYIFYNASLEIPKDEFPKMGFLNYILESYWKQAVLSIVFTQWKKKCFSSLYTLLHARWAVSWMHMCKNSLLHSKMKQFLINQYFKIDIKKSHIFRFKIVSQRDS